MTGRSSSGIPRQAVNQVSSSVDGSTVCSWPPVGRKSDRLWSKPPERKSARDSPPNVTRRNEWPRRRVRTTSSAKNRKWATAGAASSDAVTVMRVSPPWESVRPAGSPWEPAGLPGARGHRAAGLIRVS